MIFFCLLLFFAYFYYFIFIFKIEISCPHVLQGCECGDCCVRHLQPVFLRHYEALDRRAEGACPPEHCSCACREQVRPRGQAVRDGARHHGVRRVCAGGGRPRPHLWRVLREDRRGHPGDLHAGLHAPHQDGRE